MLVASLSSRNLVVPEHDSHKADRRWNENNSSTFLTVASHGSFTSAAHALRIAQPSLSYAIRVLEREVGAPLFRRLGRGVVLTDMGEALQSPARTVGHGANSAARGTTPSACC